VFISDGVVYSIRNQDFGALTRFAGQDVQVEGNVRENMLTVKRVRPVRVNQGAVRLDGSSTVAMTHRGYRPALARLSLLASAACLFVGPGSPVRNGTTPLSRTAWMRGNKSEWTVSR
jgi:hypothetical protein